MINWRRPDRRKSLETASSRSDVRGAAGRDQVQERRGRATSTGSSRAALLSRVAWRSVCVGMTSVAASLGVAITHPPLGRVIVVSVLAVILTVVGSALFGSQILSGRAFRLLRWIRNQPEPPRPTDDSAEAGGPPGAAKQ